MALTTLPVRARWAGRLRLGVLAIVALLSAHTAIYVAQYGTDVRLAAAMSAGGHDVWWAPASLVVLGIGLVLLVRTVGGLTHLELRAWRVSGARSAPRPGEVRYWGTVGSIWRRLLPLVTILFLVQENIEHLAAHGHILGLNALGGAEYPLALPIILAITLALSILGALVRWRVAVLRARITSIGDAARRPVVDDEPGGRWHTIGALAPRRWMSDRLDAGRAPPQVLRS